MKPRSSLRLFRSILALLCSLVVADAAALCVTSTEANLRSGPGTKYTKSWEVYRYMPLQKIERRGNWYRVRDIDGERHWIHKSLVGSGMRCAAVKAPKANIRTGPGTNYRQAAWGPVIRYYSFAIIGGKGRWVKIRDEIGNSGWVAKSLLWEQP